MVGLPSPEKSVSVSLGFCWGSAVVVLAENWRTAAEPMARVNPRQPGVVA